MITLKRLEWGNFRSYGENNFLELSSRSLTQLVGNNGVGKTTIVLLLQEVLFGKNIKNIKKEKLSNRYTDIPGYYITLFFDKFETAYTIKLVRSKSKITLNLFKDGEDISSHTATSTYKTIGSILEITDFKTFCQLTYQSTTDSLEFLTATDTVRKKFLISLLSMSIYLEHQDVFKAAIKVTAKEATTLLGSISTINSWINKHSEMSFEKKDLLPEVVVPESIITEILVLETKLKNITSINRKINTNNKYKKDLIALGEIKEIKEDKCTKHIEGKLLDLAVDLRETESKLDALSCVNTQPYCLACGTALSYEDTSDKVEYLRYDILQLKKERIGLEKEKSGYLDFNRKMASNRTNAENIKNLILMIDQTLSVQTLDSSELIAKISILNKEKVKLEKEQSKISKNNIKISIANSKIDVIKGQLIEFNIEKKTKEKALSALEKDVTYLNILKDAFSTNGLVAYKVEASIKILEDAINFYLAEFSTFRLRFKLSGEKLNVEIFDDNRNIIGIEEVSTGELGRINISTGLAIRKLMSTLSTTRINFLFLDEIVGVLDGEGKERLYDILQAESLNTFMVAHEETHPLIPKLEIHKINNISELRDE